MFNITRGIRGVGCACLLFSSATISFAATSDEIEMVVVGDSGNVAYPPSNHGWRAVGAVNHSFQIGKYEITREQYLSFLNAVDPSGTNSLRLYNTIDFRLDLTQPVGKKYQLATTEPDLPVTVSWYAAARFCNWLHNGKGGIGSSEGTATTGAYDTTFFDDGVASNDPIAHNPGAKFWIPTEDEWVKAAHYKGGSTKAGYWAFPNRSDEEPFGELVSKGTNSINARDRIHNIIESASKKLPVGSYPNSKSPYGALDMAGNVNEWTESWFEGDIFTPAKTKRMSRGGSFSWLTDHANIDYRLPSHRTEPKAARNGFRVAGLFTVTIPTPPVVVNQPPIAINQTVAVVEDKNASFQLSATDPDLKPAALTYKIITAPKYGTLAGSGAIRAYTPAANFYGTDSFTFQTNDGAADSNIATVRLTVTNVNDAPKLTAAGITSSPVVINKLVSLMANAGDLDNDSLTYSWKFGDGANGIGSSISHVYTTPGIFKAIVTITDGKGGTATATIPVTVLASSTNMNNIKQ